MSVSRTARSFYLILNCLSRTFLIFLKHLVFKKIKAEKEGFEPSRRVNDLLPFQGSPFGQLGYFSKLPHAIASFFRSVLYYIALSFICQELFLTFQKFFILFKQRREWDSNPRALADKRFSRPPRYDHFDISPYNVFQHFCAVLSAHVVFYHQISPLSITNLIFFSKNWTYSFNFCYMSIFTGIFTLFYSLFSFKNASATTRSSGVVILILR